MNWPGVNGDDIDAAGIGGRVVGRELSDEGLNTVAGDNRDPVPPISSVMAIGGNSGGRDTTKELPDAVAGETPTGFTTAKVVAMAVRNAVVVGA